MEKGELIAYVATLVRGANRVKFVPGDMLNVIFLERELYMKPAMYDQPSTGMVVSDGGLLIPARCEGACGAWYEGNLVLEHATFYVIVNGDGLIAALRFIGDTPDTKALEGFLEDLEPEYERILVQKQDDWYDTPLTYRDDRYFDLRKK